MDAALQSFTHAAAHRELKWDSSRAGWIKDYVKHIADSKRRALLEKFLALYEVDRKSTRLNSSHSQISYAVFCLKKKTKRAKRLRACKIDDAEFAPHQRGSLNRYDSMSELSTS